MRLLMLLLSLTVSHCLYAQHVQTLKGTVVDVETKVRLVGVSVGIIDVKPSIGNVTDENGNFAIAGVPVGKHTVQLTYVGYKTVTIPNVLVTSAKEVVLNVEMEESATNMKEVTVSGKRDKVNDMAMISVRAFDIQETERYAGSRADPARMAANFAGVLGADDSRNDIIIRGNSPQGVLWRLEEIDIPNPNHFGVAGTTGGPVTILNNKTLATSDFFTGAFPSEYGNSTAGVFDLKMRNGNKDRYEFTGQLGFLGTELAAEGPISKKNGSSFLVTYRYSTLKLFEGLNIKIGTNSIPNYQDAAFKLNFPLSKKTNLSFFGVGGLSKIDLIVSNSNDKPEELYGESDRDQYFGSNTGVVGGVLGHNINTSTYTKLIVAQTYNRNRANHDKVFRNANYEVDSLKNILGYNFVTNTTVLHWYVNKKISAKHVVRAGVINNYYMIDYVDSSRQYPPTRQDWQYRLDYRGNTNLTQGYVQYKFRPDDNWTVTAGVHAQYLSHNGSKSIEPRVGLRRTTAHSGTFSFGYGLHSQMQQLYQYFAQVPGVMPTLRQNLDMGFTRSHHLVGGYEYAFSKTVRMKTEIYYQYLFNVPIETRVGSSFSGLNQGASFSRVFPDKVVNKGTGYNYGLELTLEKSFSKGYYFMFTGALFDSKARGNDGVYRNTDYNGRFATNLLAGYEKKLGKNSTLLSGVKLTYTGGRLYSPPDVAASSQLGDYVVIDSQRNTLQFPNYFRADIKLGVRINRAKLTHEIAFDLVNILGTKNVLSLTYSDDLAQLGQYPFTKQYQLGFLPLFYYKVDFGLRRK